MDLYVIRHATAADGDLYGEDGDRPLTAEGRNEARAVGAALAKQGTVFDQMIVSPYVRAVETAELIAIACGFEAGLTVSRRLVPDAATGPVVSSLLEPALAGGVGRLVIVGHEPLLGVVVSYLLQRRGVRPKKGVCFRLRWENDPRRPAELMWAISPSQLTPVTSLDAL